MEAKQKAARRSPLVARDASVDEEELPESIGPYLPFRKMGEGGMGIVYAARQTDPPRNVALKVLRHSLTSRRVRQRFESEGRILARLRHPNIARIYGVGSVSTPASSTVPYIAMELVEGGRPITQYVTERNLSKKERVQLALKVIDGIQHGHQRAVIHRDLKPANILIGHEGSPKIIDFGVARVTTPDERGASLQTETGQLLGTPQYMSPEQFGADPNDVDLRTDVYSMGVVLFEMLCGELPYHLVSSSMLGVYQAIRDQPHRHLSTIEPSLRGDLETILDKALSKERERRYPSASALGADLRRYLQRRPIEARPPSAGYQLRMFAGRHKALVSTIAAGLLVTVLGLVISARLAYIAQQRAEDALRQAYRGNLFAAGAALVGGDLRAAERYLETAPEALRGWEWRYYKNQIPREVAILRGHEDDVVGVAFAPGGRMLASAERHVIRTWDLETRGSTASFPVEGHVQSLFFSRDGSRLFGVGNTGQESGESASFWMAQWDPADGRLLSSLTVPGERAHVSGFARHHQSGRFALLTVERLLFCDGNGRVLASRELDGRIAAHSPLAISESGERLAVMARNHSVLLLDTEGLEVQRELPGRGSGLHELVFSPDGQRLAGGAEDSSLRLWFLEPGAETEVVDLSGHGAFVDGVAFSPDGEILASSSMDGNLRLWNGESGEPLLTLQGHQGLVRDVCFSSGGELLATASFDDTVRIWDLALLEQPSVLRGHHSYVNPVVVSPDGKTLVSGGWDSLVDRAGSLRWWDADSGLELAAWKEKTVVTELAISPDGKMLAAGTDRGAVLIDAHTGEILRWIQRAAARTKVIFSPGGRLAFSDETGALCLQDPATGESLGRLVGRNGGGRPLTFSPSGRWLAVRSAGGELRILDARTLEVRRRIARGGAYCSFSSDEKRLACPDGESVCIRSFPDGEELARVSMPDHRWARFTPDGERILVGTATGKIHLIDAASYEEVATLSGHESYVFCATFAGGGERIITGSGDGTIRIRETVPIAGRLRARREWRRVARRVEPWIAEWFAEEESAAAALARVRTDSRLSSPLERRIASQLILRESLSRGTKSGP